MNKKLRKIIKETIRKIIGKNKILEKKNY